jgi:tetratricopeptide (TPR) repeat protein
MVRGKPRKRTDRTAAPPIESAVRAKAFWVSLALIAINLAVYAPLWHYGFLRYDDPLYVYQNSIVSQGLTWRGVSWAVTTYHTGNWFPLTWISHMLDVQIYGLNAGGHHVTNIILHIASTLLLFGVLHRMTGALRPSLFVAALFSLHPLQVESVAWVSERKNVLSTFIWMLTAYEYVRYVRRPHFGRYVLVLLLYACGLMAKPMLVTLPFTLLLLDVWPLGRIPIGASDANRPTALRARNRLYAVRAVLWEKLPMFALALTSCIITLASQQRNLVSSDTLPFVRRLANAPISYGAYMGKMLWPAHLGVFYGHPGSLPALQLAGAVVVLCGISLIVFGQRRRCPYLPVGWLWYLGTLVPVIGLVQVGNQVMADRYAYVPMVGLSIAVAWTARDLIGVSPVMSRALAAAAMALIAACGIATRNQVRYWETSVLLWQHAREVSAPSRTVEINLGDAYAAEGRLNEAVAHFTEALRMTTTAPEVHHDRAIALAHKNLGLVLAAQGKIDEAIVHYSEALRDMPDPLGHYKLAEMLRTRGRAAEAAQHLKSALRLQPDFADARRALETLPSSEIKHTAKSGGNH